uniref:(northern house mosquito) hypothetical protein n=1 Tax=Culex pipiens TaxID=7175 RepID=A0A8D8HDF7_CULPI
MVEIRAMAHVKSKKMTATSRLKYVEMALNSSRLVGSLKEQSRWAAPEQKWLMKKMKAGTRSNTAAAPRFPPNSRRSCSCFEALRRAYDFSRTPLSSRRKLWNSMSSWSENSCESLATLTDRDAVARPPVEVTTDR